MCMSPLRTALCGPLLVWLETLSFMIVIKWGPPLQYFAFDVFECLETIQSRIHILPILQSSAHQSSHLPCHWCDLSNFRTRQEYGLPKGWEHDIDDEEELPVSPELVRCHSNMQDRICQPKKNNSNNKFYIDVTDVTDVCIMCWRLRALSDAEPIASAVEPVARWGEPLCDAVVFMMLK